MVTKTCLCLHVYGGRTAAAWSWGGKVWGFGGGLTGPLGGHWRDAVGCLTIDDLAWERGQCEKEEEEKNNTNFPRGVSFSGWVC